METFSALLALCAGNSPVTGEFPAQRPVTQSFDVFFDLRPNKRLSKQSWGWWLCVNVMLYNFMSPKHSITSCAWVTYSKVRCLTHWPLGDLNVIFFNLVLLIGIFKSNDNVLRWMPQDLTDDKSTLVQVMARCRQATSHYLNQCWLRSPTPYGVTRPQ